MLESAYGGNDPTPFNHLEYLQKYFVEKNAGVDSQETESSCLTSSDTPEAEVGATAISATD